MEHKNVSEIRAALREIFGTLSHAGAVATKEVIAEYRRLHPNLIRSVAVRLEEMALTKLLNEVADRKTNGVNADQSFLFPEFAHIPPNIVIRDGSLKYRKPISLATLPELYGFLRAHSEKPQKKNKKIEDVEKLISQMESQEDSLKITVGEFQSRLANQK